MSALDVKITCLPNCCKFFHRVGSQTCSYRSYLVPVSSARGVQKGGAPPAYHEMFQPDALQLIRRHLDPIAAAHSKSYTSFLYQEVLSSLGTLVEYARCRYSTQCLMGQYNPMRILQALGYEASLLFRATDCSYSD